MFLYLTKPTKDAQFSSNASNNIIVKMNESLDTELHNGHVT